MFNELGFEERHHQEGLGENNVTGIRMKDENGFYVDISQPDTDKMPPRDVVSIRMNVDDFDEAYDMLVSRGFKSFYGDQTVDSGSAKSALMISPSGYSINLIQHMKK